MRFETRRHRRRREIEEHGFRDEWRSLLDQRLPEWPRLDGGERVRLEGLALRLVAEKDWEGAQGFELTDDVVVTIAGHAALLALGLDGDAFAEVEAIVVHPSTVVLRRPRTVVPGLVSDAPMPISGQASYAGPVLIVWREVLDELRRPGRGRRVVLHEFAHKLDMLDGLVDGTPPLPDEAALRRWVEVCTPAFEAVQRGEAGSVLRAYAGVNPAEFFAVATEAFFDAPASLRDEHPELYEVLMAYYGQDPVTRHLRGVEAP